MVLADPKSMKLIHIYLGDTKFVDPKAIVAGRRYMEWTQEDLAGHLNVSVRTIKRAEQGTPVRPIIHKAIINWLEGINTRIARQQAKAGITTG